MVKKLKTKQRQKQRQKQSVVVNVHVGKHSASGKSKSNPRNQSQQLPAPIYASPIQNLVPQLFSEGRQVSQSSLEEQQLKSIIKAISKDNEPTRQPMSSQAEQRAKATAMYQSTKEKSTSFNPEQFNTPSINEPKFSEKASKESEFEQLTKRRPEDYPSYSSIGESIQPTSHEIFSTPVTRQLSDEMNVVSEYTGEPSSHRVLGPGVLKQPEKHKRGKPPQTAEQKEYSRLKKLEKAEQRRREQESPFEPIFESKESYSD